jgi:hypothetical protein
MAETDADGSAVLIYQIASASEAPSQALAVLLGCALIGLVGSFVMYAQEK